MSTAPSILAFYPWSRLSQATIARSTPSPNPIPETPLIMTDLNPLPREVSRATVNLGGCEIEVVHLDNGQRVVTAESFERFMEMMESGGIDLKNVTPAEGGTND